jgi:hypothetical protein
MSQPTAVYGNQDFNESVSAQHNFTSQFNMGDPNQAMSSYARIMHEHTKRQLNTATDSARRRSKDMSPSSPS